MKGADLCHMIQSLWWQWHERECFQADETILVMLSSAWSTHTQWFFPSLQSPRETPAPVLYKKLVILMSLRPREHYEYATATADKIEALENTLG